MLNFSRIHETETGSLQREKNHRRPMISDSLLLDCLSAMTPCVWIDVASSRRVVCEEGA
jgi:hypothetical protein